MIHLVRGLQTEVKPLLSAPLLAPCELGLPRFSSREPAGRDEQRSPLPSGESLFGRPPARRRKPSAPGGNPGRGGGLLGDWSEASHCCPASRAAGLVLPPGLCEGLCFSLSSREHKRGHAFKFKIEKTKKQLSHRQNPQSKQATKASQTSKQTPSHVCPSTANSPKGDPAPQHEVGASSPRKETAPC